MNYRLLPTIILLLLCMTSFGQVELKMLVPKKTLSDLEKLIDVIEGHPDPYTKISEENFQSIVDEAKENLKEEVDEIDFYKNISKIIASIGDGHSAAWMPRYWLTNIRKEHGAFPYEVYLSNENKLYVVKAYGGSESLPIGCEILKINDISIVDIIEQLDPYISYETIPFRNDQITRSFEFMLYLVFKKADKLNFTYRYATEATVSVSTIPHKTFKKEKKDKREEREKKIALGRPYDYEIIQPGIARINIFSFSVKDIEKYEFFLNKSFKEFEQNNIHSLIIDVRGNYGGYPQVSAELFHYITDNYFKTMATSSMKVSNAHRNYFYDLYPQLRNSINTYVFEKTTYSFDMSKILNGEIGSYAFEDALYNEKPITKKYEFTGDCYLLIDRKSYSASSSFASTFQCYQMGFIIGEPTGGTKIFRAWAFWDTLPKTSYNVTMSSCLLQSTCFNLEDQPVLPDLEVETSILNRVHGLDPQLKTTLLLIDKVQKERGN